MFGLFAGEGSTFEKRFFQFSDSMDETDGRPVQGLHNMMEVTVFRAKGRKTVTPMMKAFENNFLSPKNRGMKGFQQGVAKEGSVKYDTTTEYSEEVIIVLTLTQSY